VLENSPELRERVKQIVESRRPPADAAAGPQTTKDWSLRNLPEFEELGLVQGQRLMLIDLDRCTRCGECVKACVAVHDDGHSRLFLDGPRFGDYLAPISCRKCLDPVCMIGCPVGAIHRGDVGEIRIRDWCIGCSLCERQCPYGSIQMSELVGDLEVAAPLLELLEKEVELKEVKKRAVVCDLCASTNLGREACVYACPHDAAMRVNGMQFSFERSG
jgi:Fe-S-cluster-containing hydrogenase component 2